MFHIYVLPRWGLFGAIPAAGFPGEMRSWMWLYHSSTSPFILPQVPGGRHPHANLPPRSWLPVGPNLQHIVTLHADFWKERSTSKYQKLQLFQNPKPHIWKRSLQCHDVVIYRYWHRKNKEKGVRGGREAQGVMSCQDVTRHRRNVCHLRKQGRRCVAAVILESRGCFQRRLQQHGPCGQQPKARCEVSGKSFPHRLA